MSHASHHRSDKRAWTGAVVALAAASGIVLFATPDEHAPLSLSRAVYEAAWWGLAALTLWWALRVEGRSPASMGLARPRLRSLMRGVAYALIMIATFALFYFFILPLAGAHNSSRHIANIGREPLWLTLLITLRAGIVEEWIFRYFAIEQLESATGNRWLSAIIPGVIFTALHARDWQPAHLVPVALATVLFTAIYWRRRDLFTSAVAHFLTDFVPFTLAALAAAHHG